MTTFPALGLSNYRAFLDPVELDLRPLTLLYGWNSAGKSALLRSLPILADSLSETASSPFELTGPAGRRSGFLSALCQDGDRRQLLLSLTWPDRRAEYTLQYADELHRTRVRRVKIETAQGASVLEAEAVPAPLGHYELRGTFGEHTLPLDFEGLIPAPGTPEALLDLRARLLPLRGSVHWLDSVRARPARVFEHSGSAPRQLSSDGSDCMDILLSNPGVLQDVQGFYRDRLGRRFDIREVAFPSHRALLSPLHQATFDIDLLDNGEGMIQLLPVLVAAAMVRNQSSETPRVLALEEPESHLHPPAQRALADYLCEIAAEPNPPLMVLETHSRSFLLGIQLAMAQGRLPADRVRAYWVDQDSKGHSAAAPVDFNEEGQPLRNWPRSAFSEDRELARLLVEAQLSRMDSGA